MGSLLMHLCVAKKLQKKYKFSDKFIIGNIKPDLLKLAGDSKERTHYLEDVIENSSVKSLPNVLKYEQDNKDKLKDEMVLGYISHLTEDKVWFDKYIGKYARKNANDITKIDYLEYGVTKSDKEFSKDIYNDYNNLNKYLSEKYLIDVDKIKNTLKDICANKEMKNRIDSCFIIKDADIQKDNTFITTDDVNTYIEDSFKKACIEIDKILKQ